MAVPFVDPDVCTGCELCCQIAADTFAMNADGVAEIANATGDDNDTIQEAIDSCPVTAISWKE